MRNNNEKSTNSEIAQEKDLTKDEYFSIIESLLFVSGEPLTLKQIASIIKLSSKRTKDLLKDMTVKYRQKSRGIKILNNEDKYSLVTKTENSYYVEELLGNNSRQSLSQASLETLAIIAYKQPITRIDIDEIRGVKSDRAISTLVERKLIKENGRLSVPGRPILYGTTEEFLKYFGLENINEIPSIEEFHLD
ncbi:MULTISPECIES: SMC-Scp complex subunit ScpB [Clostridium]|uniref:Segregation and condensation protein B n=2 Tax=Clostridium TaxID=1485 RepID=D8GR60_CLOLD|nr:MULTISPECIES: SMC-Scp complex subunit ScpB [Clostridium]ADK14198.1 segregation and condensation protein B [Clostridium ljungdahlii DSM 13528]AGY77424.1 SMC-Scp complex subunit ScpB [Clostridium autoethanogenum DSM 10061]ALU37565.1 Segregation and condensation protein B [Clostridium autoethanogenum DSM 10061]OAA86125.1 Segregation and condensation protein B [Clostridium ljungdahlii DSM 13528]OVY49212.1 Segregation and condensation protein B [Clostridium autoethanogenum]